jgi:pimeloyl-ACP methyl ester carboxylesterase
LPAIEQPTMQFFTSGGIRLAYIDVPPESGAGDPILLIHGFASNHAVNWVNTLWVTTLTRAGFRAIAFDNRGHGQSDKLYRVEDYDSSVMAGDAARLLDHLGIERADVMGYSMGARIAAHLAVIAPARVRSLMLGGLGIRLVHGVGLPLNIADAMEAPSLDTLTDPMQRMFRAFAEQTRSDLQALAACIRGSRQTLSEEEVAAIAAPALVSVGTSDTVAGSAQQLADIMPNARALDIPGRDHNLAVGDKAHKQGVLDFLAHRP